jgi:hypothetical protein
MPAGGYSVLLGLRLVALLFVLAAVWRVARSRWPAEPSEPVETERVDAEPVGVEPVDVEPVGVEPVDVEPVDEVDPLAGPMAGAPDRVLVRLG